MQGLCPILQKVDLSIGILCDANSKTSRLLKRSGKPHYKLGPGAIATSFDRSVVQFYQVLNYGQPDSQPSLVNVPGHLALEKDVEDL
jgi:hypothetical protein